MTSPTFRAGAWGESQKPTNVANHFDFRLGDIDDGFAKADTILEREYHTKAVHQGYIEPHASTAFYNSDGYFTIWCGTQQLFAFRDHVATVLDIPVSNVKVIPMEIGGGFGGKGMSGMYLEPVVCMLSKKSGHPVKIAMSRTEVFEGTGPTSATHIKVKLGAAFAAEAAVDELADKLSIDPIEFRLLNAAKEGTRQPTGPVYRKIGNVEMLEAAKAHDHYNTPITGKFRGRGVASGAWFNGSGPANAVASVNPDGTVSLIEGSPDIGGSRVVMAQHVAEVLGIPAESIKPAIVDTDSVGYCSGAGGSGVTFKTGWACYEAAQDVKRQMLDRMAMIWEVDPSDITYSEGTMANSTFLDYRMPTSLDLPMIDTVLVEVANPGHPFGVRGVGEACLVPPMAAIANAISHAIGTRMEQLPMTPAIVQSSINGNK